MDKQMNGIAENERVLRYIRYIKKKQLAEADNIKLYMECVNDLLANPKVDEMKNYIQHGKIDCFRHCVHVSYITFLICRHFGLDYRSAARAGLLHDMFLYDWHEKSSAHRLHGYTHPAAALANAAQVESMNNIERDMIKKHMWPLTLSLPKYPETLAIVVADKYCAVKETLFGPKQG